jgi:phosphoserine phosphatase RsbU/P
VSDDRRLAQLLEALDGLPCGLLRTDPEGLILRANRTFCSWVGYAQEELIGAKQFQDLFTVGGRIFHQTHWQPLLQIQGSVAEVKLEVIHRDGRAIPMVINAIRGERDGALVHDIAAYVAHDRDKYERELLASRRKLETAVEETKHAHTQAKDRALVAEQMMGVVSHDLRNPLSTIGMGASLLMKMGATPQQMVVLERIKRATERSNHLISDLLDFTQARLGGGLRVSMRRFALHELLRETVDELTLVFRGRELSLQIAGEGQVSGDPDRIVQLVGNLVANAMTYGDAARPVVVESTIGDVLYCISVRNWGTPIAPDFLPRIFMPMSRGDAKGEMRSLGLGLYIVDQIAKAHGGVVSVRSDAEEGTVFELQVPKESSA